MPRDTISRRTGIGSPRPLVFIPVVAAWWDAYCWKVERVIYELPAVREWAVVGMPDERWGEKPVAVVVLAENTALDLTGLAEHCRSRLAGFKVPKELVIHDSPPRNPSGKVLKRVLRAELETR